MSLLLTSFLKIFFNFYFIYLTLYFFGRLFFLLINYLNFKSWTLKDNYFYTKTSIFYPIAGYFFLGNLLLILNYFVPLKSLPVLCFLIFVILFNFKSFNIKFLKLKKYITVNHFVNFIFIPSVFLVSSFDISFHYDAGFYHLNHQNWIRESNLVIGLVNIFWPYGIGSLSEYVSSIFWQDKSLINLHYFQIIFLSTFFNFIYFHLIENKTTYFKYPSFLIVIFALLDNFGFAGGRNGFIYIQEIGKQDLQVSILVIFVGLFCISSILFNKYDIPEISLILAFSLLAIQLKLSSIFLGILILIYLYQFSIHKRFKFFHFIKINSISLFFSFAWLLKNTLTSGCLFFPVNSTCLNNYDWYRKGSTKYIEDYTSMTSFGFQSYFKDKELNVTDWFFDFFYNNGVFSEFYKSYYLNFIASIFLIILFKFIFAEKVKLEISKVIYINLFFLISVFYLILYGPIPRYSSGILTLLVSVLGFNIINLKHKYIKSAIPFLFVLSLLLIPRLNSYKSAWYNQSIALPDPRFEWNYTERKLNDIWVSPIETDMCWINQFCTSEVGGKIYIENSFFKVVNRELE